MAPPPPRAPRMVAATESLQDSPRWRFQRRDLISVAALAVAAWFALRGSDGLPFRSSDTLEPARAVDIVGSGVALDRRELGSIPRRAASGTANAASTGSRNDGGNGASSNGGSGSRSHPKPPPGGDSEQPLLQANLPVVGPVTLEQPEVPPLPGDTPDLPLPDVPTVLGATLPSLT